MVGGAELSRPARARPVAGEPTVHLLARTEAVGSVFEPGGASVPGVLRVIDPGAEVSERFDGLAHVFTLNVPVAMVGIDPAAVSAMFGRSYDLSPLQVQVLRSAVALLVQGQDELVTAARLDAADRYLGGLAGLLLRTVTDPAVDDGHGLSLRARVDAIICEQAADPLLTPAVIAGQLNTSLRQLYRAFNGTQSPAARIRRRRLESAAELLTSRPARPAVEEVAQECGFASAEYFSRAFRREFGVSPRAYRSAHRESSAIT